MDKINEIFRLKNKRHCIGITKEPPKNQNWYCHKCGTQTAEASGVDTGAPSAAASAAPAAIVTSPLPASQSTTEEEPYVNESHAHESASVAVRHSEQNHDSPNKPSPLSAAEATPTGIDTPVIDSSSANSLSFFNNSPFGALSGIDYLSSLKKKKKKS